MPVTDRHIELMQHALGLARSRVPYRNHFVASVGSNDDVLWQQIVKEGLAFTRETPEWCGGPNVYNTYFVTNEGKAVALNAMPPAPPETKWSKYVSADASITFSEWMLGERRPRLERRNGMVRMYRRVDGVREAEGIWCVTLRAAKSSYKEALKELRHASAKNKA